MLGCLCFERCISCPPNSRTAIAGQQLGGAAVLEKKDLKLVALAYRIGRLGRNDAARSNEGVHRIQEYDLIR